MMRILKALANPFLLVMQGFVAGAFLFWSTGQGPFDGQSATARPHSDARADAGIGPGPAL